MVAPQESKSMAILRFIYEEVEKRNYPPTVREIGVAVNLSSTSTIHGHVSRLVKKGYLVKDDTKPRAIEITPAGLEMLGISQTPGKIPMVGTVTAGSPILAVEEYTDSYFPLPENLSQYDGDLFMLTVQGDSMMNIGILDGDQVIVRKQESADNGDIVVAMTNEFGNGDGEATVKRFFKEADHYRLQPENDNMAPIIVRSVQILGRVVGLYRSAIY